MFSAQFACPLGAPVGLRIACCERGHVRWSLARIPAHPFNARTSLRSHFSPNSQADPVFADENGENAGIVGAKAAAGAKPNTRAQAGRVALQSIENRNQVCVTCACAILGLAISPSLLAFPLMLAVSSLASV